MKIIYAPEYDGENHVSFTPDAPCLLDTLYVGNMGLLAQLELRLGCCGFSVSDVEREAFYLLSIRKHIEGAFFEKAAQHDELGVTHQLLQWRDALVMAGWDRSSKGISPHLDDLAALEKDFHCEGIPDRWINIRKLLQDHPCDLSEITLAIEVEKAALPLLVVETLQLLEVHGATCTYTTHLTAKGEAGTDLQRLQQLLCGESADAFQHDQSLRVLRFTTPYEAYEWYATLPSHDNTVVVNKNGEMLNHILSSRNCPLGRAECQHSNPQITQLFKLGLSLCKRPLNVRNLLSYLQVPVHPLPAQLRRKLASALCNEGGIGEGWKQALEEYLNSDKDNKQQKEGLDRSIFWNIATQQEVGQEDIVNFNATLLRWAQLRMQTQQADTTTHQFATLISFCKSFATVVNHGKECGPQQLDELVQKIYRPSSEVLQQSQMGSDTMISNMERLCCEVDHLIWLDCYNQTSLPDPYAFLSQREREQLNSCGVRIPERSVMLQQQRQSMLRSLSRIHRSLTLVTTVYEGNQKTYEHPFISELHMLMGNDFVVEEPKDFVEKGEKRPVVRRSPAISYAIPPIDLPQRTESNTSLTALVQYPFNYVMEYIARLREPQLTELKDISQTKGLAAHLFIQQLVEDGNKDLDQMQQMFREDFDRRVERAIGEAGALLQLQENHIEKTLFIQQLRDSVSSLLTIMQHFELQPVGCEVALNADNFTSYGGLGVRIDCLLQNAKKEYVIFDFKWSENNSYEEKLQNNQSIQLELYKWAVEQQLGKVAAVGYYLFPLCQLITCDFPEIPEGYVRQVSPLSPSSSVIEMLRKSIEFRRQQFQKQVLEEGESFLLTEIDYAIQTEDKGLYPLEPDYNEKKIKSSPYVHKRKKRSFKETTILEKPTTHAILKARLK